MPTSPSRECLFISSSDSNFSFWFGTTLGIRKRNLGLGGSGGRCDKWGWWWCGWIPCWGGNWWWPWWGWGGGGGSGDPNNGSWLLGGRWVAPGGPLAKPPKRGEGPKPTPRAVAPSGPCPEAETGGLCNISQTPQACITKLSLFSSVLSRLLMFNCR